MRSHGRQSTHAPPLTHAAASCRAAQERFRRPRAEKTRSPVLTSSTFSAPQSEFTSASARGSAPVSSPIAGDSASPRRGPPRAEKRRRRPPPAPLPATAGDARRAPSRESAKTTTCDGRLAVGRAPSTRALGRMRIASENRHGRGAGRPRTKVARSVGRSLRRRPLDRPTTRRTRSRVTGTFIDSPAGGTGSTLAAWQRQASAL